MTKHFAVVISGCGYQDGAEINEVVLTLLNIAKHGAKYRIFAPDLKQAQVKSHYADNFKNASHLPGESRNVLEEAARIARGTIENLAQLKVAEFDGLVLPGGFGVMLNLSTLGSNGMEQGTVLPKLQEVIHDFYRAHKPIGALCIAPALVAKVLAGNTKAALKLTLGIDNSLLSQIKGVQAVECERDAIVIDDENYLVSTPAFMYGDNQLPHIDKALDQLMAQLIKMCK